MSGSRPAERLALGLALGVLAIAASLAGRALTGWLGGPGAATPQRPLAGGTAGENPPAAGPLRVIVVDGLTRVDVPRLGAVAALCGRGLALSVDVGFPTKSLAVQRVLWSGLTAQQTGSAYGNELTAWPPSAVPALVPGSVAVVESHADIARSLGFGVVEEAPELEAAAAAAVTSDAPLVLIHVLAIDVAAHRGGRGGDDYANALAAVDATLSGVLAAAPAAQWLVISDHGHVAGGGHGDVEDEVRRVAACWSPAPAGVVAPAGAEIHLIDVARWIADAVRAPRAPHAVGRTLAVAATHPDRDATLPRPGAVRVVAAALVMLAGLGGALVAARRRLAVLWPLASLAIVLLVHGVPSLSTRAAPLLLAIAGALPVALAHRLERRGGGSPARTVAALLAPALAVLLALAVLSGVAGALAGGPPPRLPLWTGALAAAGPVAIAALAALGVAILVDELVPDSGRS